MAENKRPSVDGIDRQEEEVRDLFNLLIKTRPAGMSPQTAKVARKTVAPEDPAIEEESIAQPPAPKPVVPPTPFAARERRAFVIDEEDEDNIDLELPPLVLASYDEVEGDDEDEFGDYDHFILPDDKYGYDDEVDAPPAERRNPFAVFWNALRGNVPLPCDSKGEIARKSLFWISLVVIAGALTYILYNVWWLPSFTKAMYSDLEQEYHSEDIGIVEDGEYPQQMQLSFRTLYNLNKEIRGWLSFHANGNQDFLNIEYPIMYSGDNEKYLTVDFNGNKNKNGALFFDMRAKLNSIEDTNPALIVYGHNMASGQMLAGLNKFIGNVNNARVAPMITMNTLFANGQYKVFAVVITDESALQERYFNVRRTQFGSDEDFLAYIEDLRARSLFDYPVDVQAGDELLLLSTCTVPSSAKIDDGRLTVIARKVRSGESMAVKTAAIVRNDDVIMPYAWYTIQNKQPHAYYSSGESTTLSTTTSTTVTTTDDVFERDEITGTDGVTASQTGTTTTAAAIIGVSSASAATTSTTSVSASSTASTISTESVTMATTTATTQQQ